MLLIASKLAPTNPADCQQELGVHLVPTKGFAELQRR
jgi:hypothetical protein